MKTRQEIKALAREALSEEQGTGILLVLVYALLALGIRLVYALPTWWMRAADIDLGAGIVEAIITFGMIMGSMFLHILFYYAGLLFLYVVVVNLYGEFVKIYRREPAGAGALFVELRVNFGRKLGGMLWRGLWIFLWSLLALLFISNAVFNILVWIFFGYYEAAVTFIILSILTLLPAVVKVLSYSMTPYILASCPNVKATSALTLSRRMMKGHKGKLLMLGLSFIGWLFLSVLTLGILYIVHVGPYMHTTFAGFFDTLREEAISSGAIRAEELEGSVPVYSAAQQVDAEGDQGTGGL